MISYIPHGKGEKIRIAFMFQVASFWPSWDSLYSSCIKDDRFETKLYWINEEAGEPSQMKTAELFLKTSEIEFETYDFQKIRMPCVEISTEDTSGTVIADAMLFVPVK